MKNIFLVLFLAASSAMAQFGGGVPSTGGSGDWEGGEVADATSFLDRVTFGKTLIFPASAMGALSVDVTEPRNTKTISADSTLTFSATPTSGQIFGLTLTNSDSATHAITIPSSLSAALGSARTSFTIPASSSVFIQWEYDGSVYHMFGEPVTPGNFTAKATPTTSDKLLISDEAASSLPKVVTLGTLPVSTAQAALVSDTAYNATTWNGVTTISASQNAIRDKIESMSSSGAYVLTLFSSTINSPSDGQTLFAGGGGNSISSGSAGVTHCRVRVPKTGTIINADVHARTAGTLATTEAVSHYIRHNDTTDLTIGTSTYDAIGSAATSGVLSQAVTAGDYIVLKIVCPTWTTNPTNVTWYATVTIQ